MLPLIFPPSCVGSRRAAACTDHKLPQPTTTSNRCRTGTRQTTGIRSLARAPAVYSCSYSEGWGRP